MAVSDVTARPGKIMIYVVDGKEFAHDEGGYLLAPETWSRDLAQAIAATEGITLTDAHWEVVDFLRAYYEEYEIAPPIRVLTRALARKKGAEIGNAEHLHRLFPRGPAKQACKIAGLPRPTGCV